MSNQVGKAGKLNLREIKRFTGILVLVLLGTNFSAISQLTLENCYQKARLNYPLSKRSALIESTKQLTVENIAKGFLPQLNINGQATYQSDVTAFPIKLPNVEIPTISKDQYKLYADVVQPLTIGAYLKPQKQLADATANIEQQRLETELYQLKDRINQLFFGILLLDEQQTQTSLIKQELEANVRKTNAAVTNGTAIQNNADLLTAEVLKINQRLIEVQTQRRALTDMLGYFIKEEINEETNLQRPAKQEFIKEINRPELSLFTVQKQAFGIQGDLLRADTKPKLNMFFQGGYGRPALNFLNNEFGFYYLGGLRLNWNLSSLYTLKNSQQLVNIKLREVETQEETFLFNTNIATVQQRNDINKYQLLLNTDDELLSLRSKIKNRADEQLINGLITATDYVSFVIAEDQAKQSKILHEIQLLMAHYSLKTTTGN